MQTSGLNVVTQEPRVFKVRFPARQHSALRGSGLLEMQIFGFNSSPTESETDMGPASSEFSEDPQVNLMHVQV